MSKWNTAVYLRLSSDDGEKEESNSITNQKELINLYLQKEKDLKVKDYYIDDGFTGTDFERPDFKRLLVDIKNGQINTIIVKDLSRLGRNYIEVGNYLEEIFPLYNIRFIAINDNIDSYKDPKSVNNIIVPFKNLMNDEYARDISNKVKSVLNTKRAKGEFVGLSAPYGYLKDPNDKHKFIVDKKTGKVVKKIFRMILNGKSKKEIANELNQCGILPPALYKMNESIAKSKKTETMGLWNTKMIDRILHNRAYTGDLIQGKRKRISHKVHKLVINDKEDWIICPAHHIPLISKEEFEQVQNIIYSRDIRINKNEEYDIFSGHLKCNECGRTLTIRKSKKYSYYYCTSYLKMKECSKHTTNKNELEKTVLKIVNNQIDLIIEMDKKIEQITKENKVNYDYEILNRRLNELDNEINKNETLKKSLMNDYYNNYISKDEYDEYYNEYNCKLVKYYKQKNQIKKKLEKLGYKSKENKEWVKKFIKNHNMEYLTKEIIDDLVDNIFVLENGDLRVVFKYQDEFFEAKDFINKNKCAIM